MKDLDIVNQIKNEMGLEKLVEQLGDLMYDYSNYVITDMDRCGNQQSEADYLFALKFLEGIFKELIKKEQINEIS